MDRRSIRRAHYYRLKTKRKKYFSAMNCMDSNPSARRLGITLHTPCRCSCTMCGNPRKWFNQMTIQEQISHINFIEQMEEVRDGYNTYFNVVS